MEDKMVELTRFSQVSEAEMLANLLKSEGIDCYVRDSFISDIYKGVDFGGAKVELLEKDLQRATEIMKDFGYMSSDNNTEYEQNKAKMSRNLTVIGVLILIVVGIIIFLNKYYSG